MNDLTVDFLRSRMRDPGPLSRGADAVTHRLIGYWRRRQRLMKDALATAEVVHDQAAAWRDASDDALRTELLAQREICRRRRAATGQDHPHMLAAVAEACRRQTGLQPYPVQLAAVLALRQGTLAEMATGEGKTLVAALAAVLAGWSGYPCHVITVNDYLATRDADWVRPLFHFCDLSVGRVTSDLSTEQRRDAYSRDVTYVTAKELLADFLRDRILLGRLPEAERRVIYHNATTQRRVRGRLVMRGIHTAIVDEADSVLIDEAVTPLIISRQRPNTTLTGAVKTASDIADKFERDRDYTVDPVYKEIEFLPAGRDRLVEECEPLTGIWNGEHRREELMLQALKAREFFCRDQQYVVDDDKVVIVDEFTGRLMPQRSWQQGVHQAVEAKEGLELSSLTETVARLSFQRFFRLFSHLSGMTGTAIEAAAELWHVYELPVVVLPTHRPCRRQQLPDRVFRTADEKWAAVTAEIASVHATGQPILVGTRSVRASEHLAQLLTDQGMSFQLLNARHHHEEAQIVAEAGQPQRITIATNMAGRGTDIALGPGVAECGGLHVIGTERHESRRVDRQLAGRAGRQGEPGSAQTFVSADDELLQRFLPRGSHRALAAAIERGGATGGRCAAAAFALAQHIATRRAYRQRRSVMSMDTWLDEGLAFGGTQL